MAVLQESTGAPVQLGPTGPSEWWRRASRTVGLPLSFAILVIAAWEVYCRVGNISLALLPPPSAVWMVLAENYAILLRQAVPTTLETIGSFAIASLLGVALAVAVTFSERVREALYPNIVMFQLIPKVTLAPLFIVWLGVGSQSCVIFGVFIAFFNRLHRGRARQRQPGDPAALPFAHG